LFFNTSPSFHYNIPLLLVHNTSPEFALPPYQYPDNEIYWNRKLAKYYHCQR